MIPVRVVVSSMLDPQQGSAALIGAAADGTLAGWVGSLDVLPPQGSALEFGEDELLPLAPGCTEKEALHLVAAWPSWRVTEAASIEVGSRILVIGTGSLGAKVAELSRWRGALTGLSEVPRGEPRAPWDVVVFADGPVGLLADATRACRTRGTVVLAGTYGAALDLNLYPDVHRRGLRIVCLAPYSLTPLARSEWARTAPALHRLLRRNLGAGP